MKFKIDGKDREIYINGEKQTKAINKVRLSDKGKNVNEVMKEVIDKKAKEASENGKA